MIIPRVESCQHRGLEKGRPEPVITPFYGPPAPAVSKGTLREA